ncbi:MAG: gyrase subunit [Patescibacteria group bacterium]|jgi:DNA gyrase subunit A|nr:gyrase subunit [Patescibacteria group bacterium]
MAKNEEPVNEPKRDKIISSNIVTEMKDSYLSYAMSVITSRALPDIRDGLKPVHRRILFSMHKLGVHSGAKFVKSARIVGDVIGKYHPHGDSSVYDAMVNTAQEFSFRYPLVLGQGNFGSIDGDSAAAMRYTEAKMSKFSGELLRDIEKDTVDFRSNFDDTLKEPTVMPASVPNLLLNGTLGIAVGMATNIPPHNLGEVVDATLHLIDNPKATTEDLVEFVQAPDFPTGGIVYNKKDILAAYSTGRGGVVCRGEAEITETKVGQSQIIITSIPYRVNKANLITQIADLFRDKKLQGLKDLRDESTTDIRVVIDLKSTAHPQKVLNTLYKNTQLEQNFNFNMVALVDGVPQTLSLKDFLSEFIAHRQVVVIRRTKFDLAKAEARAHILEGLKIALDHIEEVIKIIRASKDKEEAKVNLMKKFKFSDLQATAILDMRLQKLAGLERKEIEDELKEKLAIIKYLKDLLASPKKILALISDELKEIREKYGDVRRTRVIKGGVKSISEEDLIPEKDSVLVYTLGGYVKRTDPTEYRSQKRGGVGVVDLETKEEDVVTQLLNTSTHSDLLFFTNLGKAYQIKMFEIPEGRRATKGKSIMNFLSLSADEKVTSIVPMDKDKKATSEFLLLVTRQGVAKKVSAENFKDVRRSGLIAIKLTDGDELYSASFLDKTDEVIVATKKGQSIRFKSSDVREMGRSAGGVRGMKLGKSDMIVGVGIIKKDIKDATLLVMSENGFGKRTEIEEYKTQKRGGSGIKTAKVTSKTGDLVVASLITPEVSEIIAISKKGQVIKTDIDSISILGRQTQGVKIMKPRAGDSLASLTCL